MGHEDAVYLAKLAEQAERYEGTSILQHYKMLGPRIPGMFEMFRVWDPLARWTATPSP